MVIGVLARAEDELHLARVLSPGGEQAVGGEGRRGVVLAADDRLPVLGGFGEVVPQPGRRVQQEQVDVAAGGERVEHVQLPGRQPGEAEDRDARREVDEGGVGAQARARCVHALGEIRDADPGAQAPPELRLPLVGVCPGRPRANHLGPVQRVAVEQVGEVAQGGEAPCAAFRRPPR